MLKNEEKNYKNVNIVIDKKGIFGKIKNVFHNFLRTFFW